VNWFQKCCGGGIPKRREYLAWKKADIERSDLIGDFEDVG